MHIYFARVRVYKRKEFIAAALEDVEKFFDMVSAGADGGEEETAERQHLSFALKKAGLA